jgi:transcription elongation factor Elf1
MKFVKDLERHIFDNFTCRRCGKEHLEEDVDERIFVTEDNRGRYTICLNCVKEIKQKEEAVEIEEVNLFDLL